MKIKKEFFLAGFLFLTGCTSTSKQEDPHTEQGEEKIISLESVSDLGELDMIPISFQDEGWIILKDGKYGFVSNDGNIVVEPKYENATLTMHSNSDEQIDMAYLFHAEVDTSKDALLPYDYVPDPSLAYGAGVMTPPDAAFLSDDDKIINYNPYDEKEVSTLTAPVTSISTLYPIGTSRNSLEETDYAIWNPSDNSITESVPAGSILSGEQFLMGRYGRWNTPVGWFFWLPDGDKAALVNAKDGEMITGFDSASSGDLETLVGRKGKQCFVYDRHLNLVYSGTFDNGGSPLNNLVPVEINGKWNIVKLEDIKKSFPEQKSPFEKENLSLFHKLEIETTSEKAKVSEKVDSANITSVEPGPYIVQTSLNVRSGPSKLFDVVGHKSVNEQIQVFEIASQQDNSVWGKIGNDNWVCLQEGSEQYCLPSSSGDTFENPSLKDSLSLEQIGLIIVSHYTELFQPEGTYIADSPILEGNKAIFGLRYILSEEEIREKSAMGGSVSPNVLAASVTVDIDTGKVTDSCNWDVWNYK